MDFTTLLDYSPPVIGMALVGGALLHAGTAARKPDGVRSWMRPAVFVVCGLHLVIAAVVLWMLNGGGWLTATYHWDDPDDVNLVAAIFEVLCVVAVVGMLCGARRFFYRLLLDFLVIQGLLLAGAGGLVLLFVLTWKPRMM